MKKVKKKNVGIFIFDLVEVLDFLAAKNNFHIVAELNCDFCGSKVKINF